MHAMKSRRISTESMLPLSVAQGTISKKEN